MTNVTSSIKKFAAFDIDGTLMRWQLFHTIVDELARQGRVTMHEYQTMIDLFAKWKRRTEPNAFSAYEEAMMATWFALIKTVTLEEYQAAVKTVFHSQKDYVYTYTRRLIKRLRDEDYTLIAISGSHQEIVELVAEYYHFDIAIGTKYPTENGSFTGEEITPVTDKGEVLQKAVAKHQLSWQDSYAVGDSRSDAKMMKLVKYPIAFNPDQNLLTIAKQQGWNIVIERKNVIYELARQNGTYQLIM